MLKQIKTILKTAVLIAKTSPWNLPAFIGSRFLEIVQPFVTLFFSAKILDLLTQGADRPQVVQWIIAGIAVTALIHLTGRFFANLNSVEGMDLFVKLYEEMSAAMMHADNLTPDCHESGLPIPALLTDRAYAPQKMSTLPNM